MCALVTGFQTGALPVCSSQAIIASVVDAPCPVAAAGERKEIELSACRRRKALDATVAGGASDDDEADAHAPSGIAIWSRTTEPATAPLRRRNSRRSSLCARVWPRFIERTPSSCGSGFDRRADAVIGAAAADVGDRGIDVRVRWIGMGCKEGRRCLRSEEHTAEIHAQMS